MAETHDMIKSLLAEFRGYAAGMPTSYNVTMSVADIRLMLNRFETAHDHDVDIATEAMSRSVVGACVKLQEAERKCVALREALKAICGLCARLMPTWDGAVWRIKDMAEIALAETEGGAK